MIENPEVISIVELRNQLKSITPISNQTNQKAIPLENAPSHHTSINYFFEPSRIEQLRLINSTKFDLSKLIQYCIEANACFESECFLAVSMLCRSILDHVPPIFGCKSFGEVANNYSSGSKSFKQSMDHLENSLRKIADSYLHVQIRKKESLPNRTQVNFSSDFDLLLSEIVRILR